MRRKHRFSEKGRRNKDGEDKRRKQRVPSAVVVTKPMAFAPTRFLPFKVSSLAYPG